MPWPGRLPHLAPRQWRVLGLMGAVELVDHYDIGLLSLLLLQIQTGLGVAEAELGVMLATIRMGVLLSLLGGVLADRFGRRRLLLFTIVGYTVTTFLSAFARTPSEFTALQFLGRVFLYAETAVAVVVVIEEIGAQNRGFGIGLLGALGAMGHGVAAISLALVDSMPFGWRAFYALGALPLLALAWLRRSLPETRRFHARDAERRPWWRPVVALVTAYPARLIALLGVTFTAEFAAGAAVGFMSKTLQELHGFEQREVTWLYLGGGLLAIAGNQAAGLWSDRIGRRPVLIALLMVMGAAFTGFYELRGWVIVPLWILQVFALQGATVLVRALGGELFPTSYRSTASALRLAVATFGGVAGLVLESHLYGVLGSHAAAISALMPALLVAVAIVWLALPESAGRELEEVSPERASP